MSLLPQDAQERKKCPIWTGVMKYFPDAMVAIARCSYDGNQQHHPDEPLHWDKSKSSDEMDALCRHGLDDEPEHDKVAWRAIANLQREIDNGYIPKSFRVPEPITALGYMSWLKHEGYKWNYEDQRYDHESMMSISHKLMNDQYCKYVKEFK